MEDGRDKPNTTNTDAGTTERQKGVQHLALLPLVSALAPSQQVLLLQTTTCSRSQSHMKEVSRVLCRYLGENSVGGTIGGALCIPCVSHPPLYGCQSRQERAVLSQIE